MKIIQTVKSVIFVIGLFALGILTGTFLSKKTKVQKDGDAKKSREEKKNEIKNTPASALVSSAPNANELCREKDRIKTDFRQQIRNRLNEELHRLGNSRVD